jgi:glycosyltransferase involved in cell wall biosynthesis
VSRKHPRCRLAIIGDGLSTSHFELFERELGISDRVDLMGMQPRTKAAELPNRSRLFLLSSISESVPKVLLEALAFGTRVVCTNVGGCRDIVTNGGGLVVPSEDSEGSANAMDRVLSNPHSCGENSPCRVLKLPKRMIGD